MWQACTVPIFGQTSLEVWYKVFATLVSYVHGVEVISIVICTKCNDYIYIILCHNQESQRFAEFTQVRATSMNS
jgi:hypothetical protein